MSAIVMEALAMETPKRDAKRVAVVVRSNGLATVHKSKDDLREVLEVIQGNGGEVRRMPIATFSNHAALEAWVGQVTGFLPVLI